MPLPLLFNYYFKFSVVLVMVGRPSSGKT